MSVSHNTARVVTDDLVFYYDVNNPRCLPNPTVAIDSDTKLYNLAKESDHADNYLKVYDHDAVPEMSFSRHEQTGLWLYEQDGTTDTDEDPGWISNESYTRTNVNNYTFFCWFNFPYGDSSQRTDNIYGGGFQSETSFYLSPGGSSSSRGFLRYPNSGSTGSYSRTVTEFNDPQQWLCIATTDEDVSGGTYKTILYFNGLYNGESTAGSSFAAPSGTALATWGSWSGGYGPPTMRANCYMYYERTLTAEEILQNYNATKARFGTNQNIG